MTAEEERQLKAELLLEYEETAGRLRLAEGRIKDWAKKLSDAAWAMDHGAFQPDHLASVRAFVSAVPELESYLALRDRVRELARRKSRLFGADEK